jgi:hypothetical protein
LEIELNDGLDEVNGLGLEGRVHEDSIVKPENGERATFFLFSLRVEV